MERERPTRCRETWGSQRGSPRNKRETEEVPGVCSLALCCVGPCLLAVAKKCCFTLDHVFDPFGPAALIGSITRLIKEIPHRLQPTATLW